MSLFYACILIFLTLSFESVAEFDQRLIDFARNQLSSELKTKADSRKISMPVRIVERLDVYLKNPIDGTQRKDLADTIMLIVANGQGVGGLKKPGSQNATLKPEERNIAINALRHAFAQMKTRGGMNDTNALSDWLAGLIVGDETNESYKNHKAIYAAITLGALDDIATPVILNNASDASLGQATKSVKQVLANLKTTKPWLAEKLENPWYWYRADADAQRQHWSFASPQGPHEFNIYDLNGNVVAGQAEANFFNWLARKEANLYKLDIGLFPGAGGVQGIVLNQSSLGSVPNGTSRFGRPCIGFYNSTEPFSVFQNTTAATTGFWAPLIAPDGRFSDVGGDDATTWTSLNVKTLNKKKVYYKLVKGKKFYYFGNSEAYFQAHKAFALIDGADKNGFIADILKAGLEGGRQPATVAGKFGDKVDPDKWEGPMLTGQEEYDELTSISPYVYGRISGRGYKDLVMYRTLMYKFRAHPAALAFLMATKGITKIEHTGSGDQSVAPDAYWGDGLANGSFTVNASFVGAEKTKIKGHVGINTLGRYLTALGELFFSRPDLVQVVDQKSFGADCTAIEMFYDVNRGYANEKTMVALRELGRDGYYQALTAFITGTAGLPTAIPQQQVFGVYQAPQPGYASTFVAPEPQYYAPPVPSFPPPAYTAAPTHPTRSVATAPQTGASVVSSGTYGNGQQWQDLSDGTRQMKDKTAGWVSAMITLDGSQCKITNIYKDADTGENVRVLKTSDGRMAIQKHNKSSGWK